MKKNNKRKTCVTSIVLYVISAIILCYMIWTFTECHKYMQQMIAQGQITTSGNEFNIINYYMTNCAQYGLFAIVLIALGVIAQKIDCIKSSLTLNKKVGAPTVKVEEVVVKEK